jgi:predicted CopG family antitoxin
MTNNTINKPATIKILQKLVKMKKGKNPVKLNSFYVERYLIPNGKGALSCSRILRALRSDYNLISYEDPRKNNHIYEIYFNKKEVEKFIKSITEKRRNKNVQQTKGSQNNNRNN